MDPMLQMLLSTTISTAVDLLAQLGFGDAVKGLRDRLTHKTEKARQAAFEQAYQAALAKLGTADEKLLSLLKHRPFQEEVVRGLLDLNNPFDWKTASQGWGELLPEQAVGLKKFYNVLEMALIDDPTWGPVLERYHNLRSQDALQAALRQRGLPDSEQKLIQVVSHTLHGDLIQPGGVKIVQQGGQLFSGNIEQVVQIIIQQLIITQPPPPDPSDLRTLYLQHITAQSNLLPWTYFKVENADPEQGECLQLADVYIDLDTTEMRHVEREDELRQMLEKQRQAERIPAQELVNREKRLLVLGDPGFGKSTFIKHLAYQLAQAGLADNPSGGLEKLAPWEHGILLPVWVELRRLAAFVGDQPQNGDAARLVQFLQKDLRDWGMGEYWPRLLTLLMGKQAKLIILLDGLDEVPTAQRQAVVDTVSLFSSLYAQHRYVVTCRPYAYVGQPWRLHDFHEVTLAPFNEEQVDRFVDNWYLRLGKLGRLEAKRAGEKAQALKQAVRRRDLFGLAERPLLLTVMTQLHAYSGLPEDRTQLYADAVQLLLQRWEGRLGKESGVLEALNIPGLKMNDLKEGLYEVAFCAHRQCATAEGTADISEGDLRQWLAPFLGNDWSKAGQFIDYIRERAGLLIRHKPNAYTFPHRTFQEFLAACRLAARDDFPLAAAQLVQEDWDRWREVFILAVGYAARTDRLWAAIAALDNLLPQAIQEITAPQPADWQAAALAGEALLEVGLVGAQREKAGQRLYSRTQEWLVKALGHQTLPAPQRAAAGCILGRLGDPRFDQERWNLPTGDLFGFVSIPGGSFTMGTDDKDIPRLVQEFGGEKGYYENETPRHTVSLPGFYISRFPVTNAQFQAFVQAGGYNRAAYWVEAENTGAWRFENGLGRVKDLWGEERTCPFAYGEPFSLANHPVLGVTWYEALAYSRWLDEQMRSRAPLILKLPETQALASHQVAFWQGLAEMRLRVKLPSEAEWERAARGIDARQYPWESDFDPEKANTDETGIGATSAVGCFPGGASAEGAQDLAGNVWEWTRSLYWKYPYPGMDDLPGMEQRESPASTTHRVLRASSFGFDRRLARCAGRSGYGPGVRQRDLGFRLVVSLL
jgi:formylglycine-generating enzyme required for sulfatase activity